MATSPTSMKELVSTESESMGGLDVRYTQPQSTAAGDSSGHSDKIIASSDS